MNEIIIMEISQQEAEMIMKERARQEKQRKRESYVQELNDIIKRAKADGFTIAANHAFKPCEIVSSATCWTDAAGNYIGLR